MEHRAEDASELRESPRSDLGSGDGGRPPTRGPGEQGRPKGRVGSAPLLFHDPTQQLALLADSVHDPSKSLPTGIGALDSLLRRGGLMPGNFAILGGRTGTRKSTTMLNIAMNMAKEGIPVAIWGIDEPPWLYVAKLLSVFSGRSQDYIEEMWDEIDGRDIQNAYRDFARGRIHLYTGRRPGPDHLGQTLDGPGTLGGNVPRVIFIDYIGAMTREGKYGYAENSRIPLLVEELQLWSSETGCAVVALHQLSRNDEFGGTNNRNAGHIPVTKAQLRQAGEEQADLVLGTYRPTLDPIANMAVEQAKQVLGDRFDEEEYHQRRSVAKTHRTHTYLQLLKNRPGTHEETSGIILDSPDDSLRMVELEADDGR